MEEGEGLGTRLRATHTGRDRVGVGRLGTRLHTRARTGRCEVRQLSRAIGFACVQSPRGAFIMRKRSDYHKRERKRC